jgi:uncharacterized protein YqjF (DUF2071 family)
MTQADKEFVRNQAAIIADKVAVEAADRVLGAHYVYENLRTQRADKSPEVQEARRKLQDTIAEAATLARDAEALRIAAL